MVRCRICKDPKQKVIKDKVCTRCEALISSQLKVYEADYEVMRVDNARFFDVLKRTHEKVTEEELKSYYMDYHLNLFEQELKSELRLRRRRRHRNNLILLNKHINK